ncbi:MAG: coproporphyrinogen dehydrogenase HemZ [Eubacterium sp.]|nr:coproporphyrinogen dehydrogenase HemZ [Eubacterium sp.]
MTDKLYFYGRAVDYKYEIERLTRCFLPPGPLGLHYDEPVSGNNYIAFSADEKYITVTVSDGEKLQLTEETADRDDLTELRLWRMIYKLMSARTGITLPWGILTGVRPVKVIKSVYERYHNDSEAERFLTEEVLVSKEKLATAKKIISVQQPFADMLHRRSVSLYVSIPFCPTRCSYCSFISSSGSALKLKGEYLALLLKELDVYKDIVRDCGLEITSVYVGGGTPTMLEADELSRLLDKLSEFDLSHMREFTVEAGRPDTVTADKLKALKSGGVSRISINPQTMNDEVLKEIGRSHTAKQVYEAFELARQAGFDNINADIIAGLPKDTPDSFHDTLTQVCGLSPENVTVHTLSLKRSSTLYQTHGEPSGAGDMVADATKFLTDAGYQPYYMYRQKNITDNLENIGWCKPGYECLYNIFIMEELQSILAAGCAASSKLVGNGKIERIVNFKYPYEYISRFDEVTKRKREIEEFFIDNRQTL